MTSLKQVRRQRRTYSVRNRLVRGGAKTRLTVHRSSKHIYAQVIDPAGRALCGTGTTKKGLSGELTGKSKLERAAVIGREIARLAKEKGVEAVVFDRGAFKYHGRVKALADAAREGGLKF